MIQDTSEKAFKEDVVPTLGERQQQALWALERLGEATNTELARYLGWPINTITPRILELREKGLVGELDKRKCKVTGRMAYVWGLAKTQTKLF